MKTEILKITMFVVAAIWLTGCNKEKDDIKPNPQPEKIPEATDVNKFIHRELQTYYLWVNDVPNLVNPNFSNKDSLNKFLNKYTKPDELFNSLLYPLDRQKGWSFIVDDSKKIDNWLAGISESMGFEFRLAYKPGSNTDLIGWVVYVLKDSPASRAGVKRGDLFSMVDGQQLTAANYYSLMFTKITYTLGFAEYQNNSYVANGKSVKMTAELIEENPVFFDSIYQINNHKVGYLVYNGFVSAYNEKQKVFYELELNKVFGKFKANGVNKLVLDLRYNGGGSGLTAMYLGSMIHSTDESKILYKQQWNSLLQSEILKYYGDKFLNKTLKSVIDTHTFVLSNKTKMVMPKTPINSLGLNDIYIIALNSSASASELLINGLRPFMNVTHVGTNTSGKFTGSITLYDEDNNGKRNTSHTWAMQPIVFKYSNSIGKSDFADGLVPDVSLTEYVNLLLPLGNPNEPHLKACLDLIRGLKKATFDNGIKLREYGFSKDLRVEENVRILNEELDSRLLKRISTIRE
jgi:C-terminal processing protease CtpA/Prc